MDRRGNDDGRRTERAISDGCTAFHQILHGAPLATLAV